MDLRRCWIYLSAAAATTQAHSLSNIIVNSFGTTESRVDKPTDDPIRSGIEQRNLGSLHLNEITVVTAHNAHANNFAAGDNMAKQLATNQHYSIYHLLKHVGVRGLMLDIEYDPLDSDVRLVHGSVDYNSFQDVLRSEIIPFLEEDTDALIIIDLETLGDKTMLRDQLLLVLANNPGFANRVFRMSDTKWKDHGEWPLIREMREADQRVIILSDSVTLKSSEHGIMWRNDIVMVRVFSCCFAVLQSALKQLLIAIFIQYL